MSIVLATAVTMGNINSAISGMVTRITYVYDVDTEDDNDLVEIFCNDGLSRSFYRKDISL